MVEKGVVVLQGTIRDQRQRSALRVAAENIPGVKEVIDKLLEFDMTMDRLKAAAVVIGVEQRELLAAVNPVLGVVDVEHDALGHLPRVHYDDMSFVDDQGNRFLFGAETSGVFRGAFFSPSGKIYSSFEKVD
jgi:hypothetical protein